MAYDPSSHEESPFTEHRGLAPQASGVRGTRLDDDLDASELADRGRESVASVLSGVIEDPETLSEELYSDIEDAEIAEAEQTDLAQFSTGRDRGYDLDAFEDWLRLSRKYPSLTPEQSDRYVRMMRSGDDELREIAEDRLVAHSVRWIVKCLNECATRQIMRTPGDLRNDALSAAREGFLIGLRQYDPEKAERRGVVGHRKTVLGFTRYWIRKVYMEWYYTAVLKLNPDAAEDRNRVMAASQALERAVAEGHTMGGERGGYQQRYRDPIHEVTAYLEERAVERLAQRTLRAELQRRPTKEEFEARCAEYRAELADNQLKARQGVARSELLRELGREPEAAEVNRRVTEIIKERRWVDYTVPRALRRAGALTPGRVRDLINYSTVQESFDAPVQPGDESGPTLKEYIASEDLTPDKVIAQEQLSNALNAMLAMVPGSKARELYRQRYGFGHNIHEPYPVSNPEELMYWLGRSSRDSVMAQEAQVTRDLRGEVLVDPDALIIPGLEYSPNGIRRMHIALEELAVAVREAETQFSLARDMTQRMRAEVELSEARRALSDKERALKEIQEAIRSVVDLREALRSEGVELSAAGEVACPLADGCLGTLRVDAQRFACDSCGRSGDLYDWLEQSGQGTGADRDIAAARHALALPPNLEREGQNLVGVRDPVRRNRLRGLVT